MIVYSIMLCCSVAILAQAALATDMLTRGSCWFVYDGCGICFLIFAYGLLALSKLVVCRLGWRPWGPLGAKFGIVYYELLYVLGMWAHLACMLTDPGAVPLDMQIEDAPSAKLRSHHVHIIVVFANAAS